MKVNNLKIRKSVLLTVMGLSLITLNKNNVYAAERGEIKLEIEPEIKNENIYEYDANDKEYLLFQKYERNSLNEDFTETYDYYSVEIGKSIPADSDCNKYVFVGELTLDTLRNMMYTTVSDNYMDAALGNFISEDRLYKECYKNVNLEAFDDTINKIVSEDGTVLGYTPKKRIFEYRSNHK